MDFFRAFCTLFLKYAFSFFSFFGLSENEETFCYHTARKLVPILTLGLFRVESYENSQLLNWRTLSISFAETLGFVFWLFIFMTILAALGW